MIEIPLERAQALRDVAAAARKVNAILGGASRIAMDFPASPKSELREALAALDATAVSSPDKATDTQL